MGSLLPAYHGMTFYRRENENITCCLVRARVGKPRAISSGGHLLRKPRFSPVLVPDMRGARGQASLGGAMTAAVIR